MYSAVAWVYDNEFGHVKEHLECSKAYNEFNREAGHGGEYYPINEWDGFRKHVETIKQIYKLN